MAHDPAVRRRKNVAGLAVALVAGALIAIKVSQAVRIGPGWDTYALLANAAHFAGRSIGYVEMHRPPVMSWLTSFVFRLGYFDVPAIQWVDGALSLAAILALFALLRRRFDPGIAAAGSLAMLGLPALWTYLGSGYTDFPAVGVALWGLWCMVKATEDDPRWYVLAVPLLVAAALTRYGTLVVAIPAIAILALRSRPFRHWRHLALGTVMGLVVFAPAAVAYEHYLGDAFAPFLSAIEYGTGSNGVQAASSSAGLGSGYLTNILGLLMPEGAGLAALLLLVVALLGFASAAVARLPRLASTRWRAFALIAMLTLAVGAQLSGGAAIRQATLLGGVLVAFWTFAPRGEDGRITPEAALDAMMLTLLLAYLDAHGHMQVKLGRYFIAIAPGLIYVLLLGWRLWLAEVVAHALERDASVGRRSSTVAERTVTRIAWTSASVLLLSGIAFNLATPERRSDPVVEGARVTAEWLQASDPSVDDSIIYSDVWPLTSWYLGREVYPMPSFEDEKAFEHDLEKYEVAYYVTTASRRFDNYTEVTRDGPVAVLQRTVESTLDMPRIRLLGDAWDNYLESVTGYDIQLIYPPGRVDRLRSMRIDSVTAEQLREYDAVAVYAASWYDKTRAERTLREYVEGGGVLIVDASANLSAMANTLADTVFLDTIIRRADVRPGATLWASDELIALEPQLRTIDAARFVDEGGGAWFGATYSYIDGLADGTVLATVDGSPAVVRQEMGDGVIYWIGSNLVWHAFLTENADESALIRATIADALSHSAETSGAVPPPAP